MAFWTNLWNQAKRLDLVERELDYYKRALQKEEERNALLESALTKEYSDHKKTLRRVADQACKQLGLPQNYVKDGESSKSVIPPPPDPEENAISDMVLWQAKTQMQCDIDDGIVPMALEEYVKIIQEAPTQFILN